MTDLLIANTTPIDPDAALIDGRYQVIEVLSNHLWEKTYLAQDTRRPSQPQCVIQQIQPVVSIPNYEEAVRHLFRREAMLLERLSEHPQIPQLLACFEDRRGFYLVQEYINGYPLSIELAPNQPWNPNRVVQLLLECLEPLAFVHDQGMRHGNLKPDNLLRRVSNQQLVLVNFDSLRQVHQTLIALHDQAEAIVPLHNQGYQAPEQLQGAPRTASDVYAIGMIAVQALTGVYPLNLVRDPATAEVLWQPQDCGGTDLRRNLTAVLSRMVAPDPNQRYQTAAEVLADLHRILQPVAPPQEAETLAATDSPSQAEARSGESADRLEATGAALLVGVGVGAVLSATVGGYAVLVSPAATVDQGNQILERATSKYQSGQLPQAISLAETIPVTSQVYPSAQVAIVRWRKDWKTAAETYQAMLTAYSHENWLEVLEERRKLPDISHWQEQSAAIMREATAKADKQAMRLLQQAYDRAEAREFTAAIDLLQQIPSVASIYPKSQEKLGEYRQKQETYAVALLQKAYDRAILRDFGGAILYLKQVPAGTEAHARSQQKLAEYSTKQKLQAESLLVKASQQAEEQDFTSAITSLEKVPRGTTLDQVIDSKRSEYSDKLSVWSDYWLQQATDQANGRNFTAAISTLEKVPIGTPAYAEAREKIIQYSTQESDDTELSDEEVAASWSIDLNPGSYLRATE